jgi:hypothetical protein
MVATDTLERVERRRRTRMQVRWSISFFQSDTEVVESTTWNLSSDGFYCLANIRFVPGEIRECTLGIPLHHPNPGNEVMLVWCRVRVIRVEMTGETGLFGVGFQIEDYRFAYRPESQPRISAAPVEAPHNAPV